jgi:hypothetical protein
MVPGRIDGTPKHALGALLAEAGLNGFGDPDTIIIPWGLIACSKIAVPVRLSSAEN